MSATVTAGRGAEAETFAERVRAIFADRDPRPDEIGVWRFTGTLMDGRRFTTFALVGADDWDAPHVRQYVVHPYRMAKNLLTGESSDAIPPELEPVS